MSTICGNQAIVPVPVDLVIVLDGQETRSLARMDIYVRNLFVMYEKVEG
jgi:hypothetical protein